jgi:hypothetical protein
MFCREDRSLKRGYWSLKGEKSMRGGKGLKLPLDNTVCCWFASYGSECSKTTAVDDDMA